MIVWLSLLVLFLHRISAQNALHPTDEPQISLLALDDLIRNYFDIAIKDLIFYQQAATLQANHEHWDIIGEAIRTLNASRTVRIEQAANVTETRKYATRILNVIVVDGEQSFR